MKIIFHIPNSWAERITALDNLKRSKNGKPLTWVVRKAVRDRALWFHAPPGAKKGL